MIGGLSQAKETQELCKKPNDIRGDASVAGVAALSDILFITHTITKVKISVQ